MSLRQLGAGPICPMFFDLAHAHMRLVFQVENEDLAVVRLTRFGCSYDGVCYIFDSIAWNRCLDLEHGQKLRRILEAAINLGRSALAIIFGLGHRECMDSDPC